MPRTTMGKWSVGLIGAFIFFMVVFFVLVESGERGGDTFFSNLALTIPILIAGACGVAGFVVGLIAMIRKRERSWLVYIATAIGAFIAFWISAEILFPH
ncbi:hypothetical protein ACFL0L_02250 [Patescibacteria group bacterium]